MLAYRLTYTQSGVSKSAHGSREKVSIILNRVRKEADKNSIKVHTLNQGKDVTRTFKT